MLTDESDKIAAAESRLMELAGALLSLDPSRKQIVVPSRATESERSQILEMTEATVIIDLAGQVECFDETAQTLLGFSEADVLGRPVSVFLADGPRSQESGIQIVPDSRGVRRLLISPNVLARRRDGTLLPIDIKSRRITVGGSERFLITFDDLLERRDREAPVQRAQARYRALVEQIPAVTFTCALDEGLNEMYVSPQIETLLGFTAEEWLDDPVLWFWRLHPDDRDMWTAEFSRGVSTGGPFRAECRVMARDGHIVWIHGEAWLVRDDAGRPIMLQGICFDISESKRAEQIMRDAQSMKIRHERLAAIGQLAASIGHDLRNPLAAVRNAHFFLNRRIATTELMKEERVGQFLELMDKELRNCSRIISDLLDFARERPVSVAAVSLHALVADAVSVIPCPAHVTIEILIPEDAPPVEVDQDQFRQALINLIQNGAESVPVERAGRVLIRSVFDTDTVHLSIQDNGTGIPDELKEKIFEPLFTNKSKGTGLGLPIVQNILRRHGADLTLTTTAGSGSLFRITLRRTAAVPTAS